MSVTFHFVESFKKKRIYSNLLKLFYLFIRKTCFANQICFPFRKFDCSTVKKKKRNKGLNKRKKSQEIKSQRVIAGTYIKFRKKLQIAMKGNSLLKINMRRKSGYMHISC